MTNWQYIVYYLLSGALMVMMAIGIAFSAVMPALDRWNKRYFITLFSLFLLCCVTCFIAVLFWEDPTKAQAARIVYIFEGLFLSTPIYMPMLFLLHSCGEDLKSSPLFKAATVFEGIYIVWLAVIQFTDVFYNVTPDNHFIRGPLWPLCLTPLVMILILNIAGVFKMRKKLSRKHFGALLQYLLPMTAAIILHMFGNVELFVILCMALLAMIMFSLILTDNMEQYARQQREITNQRVGILMLQMRPHFICNTMMGIYYLCDKDPQQAKQVTLDFTTYLRQNFSAIASEDTVPFSDELKHTHAYLAVEQAQYEDRLFVDYDTPHTLFRVPPLTLQRIAGDADGSGTVDLRDVVLTLRHLAGGWGVQIDERAADVDADGEGTTKDAVQMRRYLAGGWDVTLQNAPEEKQLTMQIGDTPVAVQWEDNAAVDALRALVKDAPLTIDMSMYGGFEQVGSIGTNLPQNDVRTTTAPGDIVLYSGSQMVVFYGSNTWAYTRLGKVTDKTDAQMAALLSGGDVTITLSF